MRRARPVLAALSSRVVHVGEMWRRAANWLPAGADHTEIVRWLEHTREGTGDFTE